MWSGFTGIYYFLITADDNSLYVRNISIYVTQLYLRRSFVQMKFYIPFIYKVTCFVYFIFNFCLNQQKN